MLKDKQILLELPQSYKPQAKAWSKHGCLFMKGKLASCDFLSCEVTA